MIVSIAGKPGSGKTTIAKRLAQALGVSYVSTGALFRQLAIDRGLSLAEFSRLSEVDPSIDRTVDDYQRRLPSKEPSFVIEGRLAFRFIPQSVKIFLDVSLDESAARVWAAVQSRERGREDEQFDSLAAVRASLEHRAASERRRYAATYSIADLYDPKQYDFFLDTTALTLEEVFDQVLTFVRQRQQ